MEYLLAIEISPLIACSGKSQTSYQRDGHLRHQEKPMCGILGMLHLEVSSGSYSEDTRNISLGALTRGGIELSLRNNSEYFSPKQRLLLRGKCFTRLLSQLG